jgi:hypothetical protein
MLPLCIVLVAVLASGCVLSKRGSLESLNPMGQSNFRQSIAIVCIAVGAFAGYLYSSSG